MTARDELKFYRIEDEKLTEAVAIDGGQRHGLLRALLGPRLPKK
jgi:hypothetical protein